MSQAIKRALPLAAETDRFPFAWYAVAPSSSIRRRPRALRRLGRDLVVFRQANGDAVLAGGRCPHRGANLADGKVVGGKLECPYHGFRFRGDGSCAAVPCEGRDYSPPTRLALAPFPTREAHGFV